MVISNRVILAIQVIQALNENPGKVINMQEFGQSCLRSHRYMQQIARVLRKNGFIGSVMGPKGGYVKTKNLNEINLCALIQAVENALDNSVVTKREQGHFDKFFLKVFDGYTLEDVLDDEP